MLELTTSQIGGMVGSYLLPLFRIASLLMTMPLIGTQLVPTRVRLYLALGITAVIAPSLPPMPPVDAVTLQAFLLIAEQILVGAVMGFALQLFFHAFVVAGQILAVQMGLGFASMVDPTTPWRASLSAAAPLGTASLAILASALPGTTALVAETPDLSGLWHFETGIVLNYSR